MAKRTAFYDIHKSIGGKLVDFAGFEMPVEYTGVNDEHINVRQNVGVFDVSHMAVVDIIGKDAKAYLRYLLANDVAKLINRLSSFVVCVADKYISW